MKKVFVPFLMFAQLLFAQMPEMKRVKGADIQTGGDFYDGEFISQESAPVESGYIKGFYISEPVTQRLYEEVTRKNPSKVKDPDAPVTGVSLTDVMWFLHLCNSSYEMFQDYDKEATDLRRFGYRLPLEEEWELAVKSGVIKPSSISEWTLNKRDTSKLRFNLTDENHDFKLDINWRYVLRGNGSETKRRFLCPDESDDQTGFRIVRTDRTEWGFPEQKQVSLEAKNRANVTSENLDEFLSKAESEIESESDGFVHVNLVFAEMIRPLWLDRLSEVFETHPKIRANIDLKDCVFQLPEIDGTNIPDENYFLSVFYMDALESLIVPDDCLQCILYDCDNVKYVQLSEKQNKFVNTFTACFSLKYIFIPREKNDDDVTVDFSVPFGCKTSYVWESKAEEYRKKHSDFDLPVEGAKDPKDCAVTFNKPGIISNQKISAKISIPENQMKKQTATFKLVYLQDRSVSVYETKFNVTGKKKEYFLKNLDARSFEWKEFNNLTIQEHPYAEEEFIILVPEITFEDGTVYDFYTTGFVVADEENYYSD